MSLLLDHFQELITNTLYNDSEFTTLCTNELGGKLNFYQDSDIQRSSEIKPCLIAHKLMMDDDKKNQESWQIEIQIIAAASRTPVNVGGIWIFETPKKVEKITSEAIKLVECRLRDLGISDGTKVYKDVFVDRVVTAISEIGETDEIRSVVFIEFGRTIKLNK